MTPTRAIPVEEAIEQYLQSRHDVTAATTYNHETRLRHFAEWARIEGLESVDELTGFHLQQYKNWRLNGDRAPDCNLVTIEQSLHTLRVFLRWAEKAELVSDDLAEKVVIPNVSSQDKARDVAISHERAEEIIDYLCRYEWASSAHVIFHTLYHCGMRRSGLRALDVDDWYPDDQYLAIRNREEKGTRLKLGDRGERNVSVVDERLVDALNDWIEEQRPDVTDEYGRKPLIASTHGRMHYQSITKICYKVTRPCWYGVECPHDRDPDDCKHNEYAGYSGCPSSISAHPVRRSSITHHLAEDTPAEVCSDRMAVSKQVLDRHYDARDEEQKRQNRKQYLPDR